MVLPSEPEFEQALTELTLSLGPFLKANPGAWVLDLRSCDLPI